MVNKLSTCKINVQYEIKQIAGDEAMIRFFKHVGIHVGDTLKLVNILNRHYIVYIKGSRYAMEETIASNLFVKQYD